MGSGPLAPLAPPSHPGVKATESEVSESGQTPGPGWAIVNSEWDRGLFGDQEDQGTARVEQGTVRVRSGGRPGGRRRMGQFSCAEHLSLSRVYIPHKNNENALLLLVNVNTKKDCISNYSASD